MLAILMWMSDEVRAHLGTARAGSCGVFCFHKEPAVEGRRSEGGRMVGPYCVVSPLLLTTIIVPHRQLSSYHLIHERGMIRGVWCALYRQAVRPALAPSNPGSATVYSGNYGS
ncbi:hypothetical protein BDR07DRAFT_490918 [Suillus spraguei]|nr:hypothetical protein BDR07DRAFT_490918 [Suillus spraguei]